MRTIDFVAYETFRRPGKSVTGICYILLAVSIFVAAETVNKALRDRTKEQLLRFGANILVQPKGRAFDSQIGAAEGGVLLPEKYAQNVRSIKHKKMLVAVSPKLYQRFEVNGQSISVAGITPDEQKAKPWWIVDTGQPEDAFLGEKEIFPGEKEILLGHHVASRLGGDPAEIHLGDETFQVSGVLDETGSPDDFTAFIRLDVLQRIAHRPGMVSLIEVSTSCIACKEMDVRDVAKQIDEAVPEDGEVVLKSQIAEAQMGTLKKVKAFTMVTYLVVLTPCVFLLVNFMSASVSERRGEIGMLLAMGMAPRRIQQIFLLKIGIFAVTGGLFGYLFGSGVSMLLGPLVADASVSPLPHLLPAAFGLSLGLGAVSSILPLRRISQLDPIEAFRTT